MPTYVIDPAFELIEQRIRTHRAQNHFDVVVQTRSKKPSFYANCMSGVRRLISGICHRPDQICQSLSGHDCTKFVGQKFLSVFLTVICVLLVALFIYGAISKLIEAIIHFFTKWLPDLSWLTKMSLPSF